MEPKHVTSALQDAVRAVIPILGAADRRVLEALFLCANHSASAGELAKILGATAVVQINGAIGRFGRKVLDELGTHPDRLAPGEFQLWTVIATGHSEQDRGFVWTLREEVIQGLLASGFASYGDTLPNEVFGSEALIEGAVRQITVNAYERNPVARARCVDAYGAVCVVCNFDFISKYGPSTAGFIHVHHIKPLASVAAEHEINPIEDLRPVCPNCHAVIHMTNPPRSIEEVKAMLSCFGESSK